MAYYSILKEENGDPVVVKNQATTNWEAVYVLESCKACNGTGNMGKIRGCTHCLGTGKFNGGVECIYCEGSGNVEDINLGYRIPCRCLVLESDLLKAKEEAYAE